MMRREPYESSSTTWMDDVVDSSGVGFIGGTMGGFIYHLSKGLFGRRGFATSFRSASLKAPPVGGIGVRFTLAYYGVCVGLAYLRRKDDNFNLFVASAVASGSVRAPHGVGSASRAALCGGSVLTLFYVWVEEQQKKRDAVKYRHTRPPGCLVDKRAKHQLTMSHN